MTMSLLTTSTWQRICRVIYSHQFIIVMLSLAAFLHNILMNGANNVILSSLQKEFYLSSRETGVYVSVYDIGSLISSILVSFASTRGSKPRWIAFGMVALFFGCMIIIIPHFIKPSDSDDVTSTTATATATDATAVFQFNQTQQAAPIAARATDNSIELCNYSLVMDVVSQQQVKHYRPVTNWTQLKSNPNSRSIIRSLGNKGGKGSGGGATTEANSFWGWFQMKHLLYLGNTINGFSSASMTSITFSYIEDVAPPNLSSMYESIYYAIGAFGVGVGFIITSKFLTVHTDINSMKELPTWLKTSHPNWIGAWWLPFLLFGFISLILAVIIFTFPRKLDHSEYMKRRAAKKLNQKHSELIALNTNGDTSAAAAAAASAPATDNANATLLSADADNTAAAPIGQHGDNHFLNTIDELVIGSMMSLNEITKAKSASIVSLNTASAARKKKRPIVLPPPSSAATSTGGATIEIDAHTATENESGDDHEVSLVQNALALLKNPVYVFIIIMAAIEGLLQNSFLAFAALFLEYQYRLASGTASFVLGLLSIPPLMIGGILSGYIVKRLKYKAANCFRLLIVVLAVNIGVYAGFMIYCKEPNMISIGQALQQQSTSAPNYVVSANCNCNPKIFKPVCLKHSDDVFFQSACLAGCAEFEKGTDFYLNCTQEPATYRRKPSANHNQNDDDEPENYFLNGLCPTESCNVKLVVSYACIFLLMLFNALTFLPFLKATIAVVANKEMNSIGLGIRQFFMNAFGTIPGPILFGSVIDSACTYWHTDQHDQRVCKIYNNQKFAFGFGILGVGFKAACLLLVILSLFVLKRQKKSAANIASK